MPHDTALAWTTQLQPIRPWVPCHCHACQERTHWIQWRETGWLRLLGLPVLPFWPRHVLACERCDDRLHLTLREGRALARHAAPVIVAALIRRHQLAGKTEAQRRYLLGQDDTDWGEMSKL